MYLSEFCVQNRIMYKALCKFSWLMQAVKCFVESVMTSNAYFNLFVYTAIIFDFYEHL